MEQKTIWMKHLIIGIVFSLLFLSCNKGSIEENSVFENFTYTNLSSHSIKVYAYKDNFMTNYNIENNNGVFQKQELLFGIVDSLIINSDSLKIVFCSNKILKFKHDSNFIFNILNRDNYNHNVEGNQHYYDYIFTVDDYETAEDFNGNCE